MVLRLFCFRTVSSKNNNFTMWFQCVPVSFYGKFKKKVRKILLAHGLLDFCSPRATGQVEMSNPEII